MQKVFAFSAIVLIGLAFLAFVAYLPSVNAIGPIYIHSDGSIDPITAPIQQVGSVYSLTSDISSSSDGIIIERSNIVLRGAGYVLGGSVTGTGVKLNTVQNVTVENMIIAGFNDGIGINQTTYSRIQDNFLANNSYSGICFQVTESESHFNTIDNNTLTNNDVGIMAEGDSINSTIINNQITYNNWGIRYGYEGHAWVNTTIRGNNISYNTNDGVAFLSYKAWSKNNYIIANNIANNKVGVDLSFSCDGHVISQNNITGNSELGISLTITSDDKVENNRIQNNGAGILVGGVYDPPGCSYIEIINNDIKLNTGYGINITASRDCIIHHNSIAQNAQGIVLGYINVFVDHYSEDNRFYANTIASNTQYGIHAINSTNNQFYHNNIQSNPTQVYAQDATDIWDNGYPSGGNYWSDYSGTDNNSDGIGDMPYVIDASNQDRYPLVNPTTGEETKYLVVRGLENTIYYRVYAPSTGHWGAWTQLPGLTPNSPAAALCGTELHFVVRSMDGYALYHGYVDLLSGSFSGWSLISGITPSAPTLTGDYSRLCLVVRGLDDGIFYRSYDPETDSWNSWSRLPAGATADTPAATLLEDKLHICVRGLDGTSIWHSTVELESTAFSGWQNIPGLTDSKHTLTASQDRSQVYLAVRGLDNVVYYKTWTSSGWTGWSAITLGTTCDGPAAATSWEKLCLVVRGLDGNSLWYGSVQTNTGTFSGWTAVSGITQNKPTLTSP